jgi:hypothetical protein
MPLIGLALAGVRRHAARPPPWNKVSERLRESAERLAGIARTVLGAVLLAEKLFS